MSWFHASTTAVDARDHASAAEIVACFRNETKLLDRLAFFITADRTTAEQAVAQACETTLQGNRPFRNWFSSGPRLRRLPVQHRSKDWRFARVKRCTKNDDARMSIIYAI
jgi:hypothetical protein